MRLYTIQKTVYHTWHKEPETGFDAINFGLAENIGEEHVTSDSVNDFLKYKTMDELGKKFDRMAPKDQLETVVKKLKEHNIYSEDYVDWITKEKTVMPYIFSNSKEAKTYADVNFNNNVPDGHCVYNVIEIEPKGDLKEIFTK